MRRKSYAGARVLDDGWCGRGVRFIGEFLGVTGYGNLGCDQSQWARGRAVPCPERDQ